MLYFVIIVSIIFGAIGIYLFYYTYRQHANITKAAEPLPISQVLKISLLTGISSVLLFYALVTIGGTIAENKTNWSFQELISVGVFSAVIAVFVFLGTIYSLILTVKYRDHLTNKYKAKK
jgi:hypothetical protein